MVKDTTTCIPSLNMQPILYVFCCVLFLVCDCCMANAIIMKRNSVIHDPGYNNAYLVDGGTIHCAPYHGRNIAPWFGIIYCRVHVYYQDGTNNFTSGYDPAGRNSNNDDSCTNTAREADVASGAMFDYQGETCHFHEIPITSNSNPPDPDWYNSIRICAATVSGNSDAGIQDYKNNIALTENCTHPHPPIDATVCKIDNSITIDYGAVTPAAFNGSKKSGAGSVTCIRNDASVKLYFAEPTINLSNGGKATLSFSDGNDVDNITVDAKENVPVPFTVYSTLSSSQDVAMGDFEGSTTLISDIQ